MKNECNIVRDLLPLYIDGAVSEDSRRLVEEHTAICEDCAKERREMLLALPENQEPKREQAVLQRAAKKLRKKHMRRGGIMAVVGLLLGVALLFVGNAVFQYLRYTYDVPMPLDSYHVQLSTVDDKLICSIVQNELKVSFGWGYSGETTADGRGYVIDLSAVTSRLPSPSTPNKYGTYVFEWQDGKIYRDGTQVTLITRTDAKGNQEIIYEYGVDESRVVPASEQLEEYYHLEELSMLYAELYDTSSSLLARIIDESELPFARIGNDHDELREQMSELLRQQRELLPLIPEWQ